VLIGNNDELYPSTIQEKVIKVMPF